MTQTANSSAHPESALTVAWQAWLSRNLLDGVSDDDLVAVLAGAGLSVESARIEIANARKHPLMIGAFDALRPKLKQQSLLDLYSHLHRQSGRHHEVPRLSNLAPEAFYEHYYFANRPVVLEGFAAHWPAVKRWSPEYFAERFGDVEIEITQGRSSDDDYEWNVNKHKTKTNVSEFVSLLRRGGPTNDHYLVAQNHAFERTELGRLIEDVVYDDGWLDPSDTRFATVGLWLGPADTVTPLHHDGTNVFFVQVHGRKRFKMIPSFELARVYNHRWVFSAVDAERPDLERHPDYANASVADVVLNAGDALLIPVGWWHWVKALDVSISLNFQNFLVEGGNTHWADSSWWTTPIR